MEKAIIFDWVGTLYKFGGKGLFDYSEKVVAEAKNKGYGIVILSKATPINFDLRKSQMSKLEGYADLVIVDTYKNEEQFMKCIKYLNVKPENTLVVGDRTCNEIRIGNKIGCKTVWIQRGKHANELPNKKSGKPTYTIDSIEDLLRLL